MRLAIAWVCTAQGWRAISAITRPARKVIP